MTGKTNSQHFCRCVKVDTRAVKWAWECCFRGEGVFADANPNTNKPNKTFWGEIRLHPILTMSSSSMDLEESLMWLHFLQSVICCINSGFNVNVMLLAIDLEWCCNIEKAPTDGSHLFQGVCWTGGQCWEEVQQQKIEYLHLLILIFYRGAPYTDKCIQTDGGRKDEDTIWKTHSPNNVAKSLVIQHFLNKAPEDMATPMIGSRVRHLIQHQWKAGRGSHSLGVPITPWAKLTNTRETLKNVQSSEKKKFELFWFEASVQCPCSSPRWCVCQKGKVQSPYSHLNHKVEWNFHHHIINLLIFQS